MAGCRDEERLRERLLEQIERLKRRPPIHPLAIIALILLGYALARLLGR